MRTAPGRTRWAWLRTSQISSDTPASSPSAPGFTYTVLDETDDVVGCVYIYPCDDGVHDAFVLSWVRESQAPKDGDLRRAVADWLTSDAWPFARPLYEPLLS